METGYTRNSTVVATYSTVPSSQSPVSPDRHVLQAHTGTGSSSDWHPRRRKVKEKLQFMRRNVGGRACVPAQTDKDG